MKISKLIKELQKLPQDYDIYIRYGSNGQIGDIKMEYVKDYKGIGEFYSLYSNGQNIQTRKELETLFANVLTEMQ